MPSPPRPALLHKPAAGFTLVELVLAIMVLGILAAMAMPRLINLRSDAVQAVTDGMAGTAAAAMAVNHSGCLVTGQVPSGNKCIRVDNCDDVWLLVQGGNPNAAQWDVVPGAIGSNTISVDCTVRHNPAGIGVVAGRVSSVFQGIGAGQ